MAFVASSGRAMRCGIKYRRLCEGDNISCFVESAAISRRYGVNTEIHANIKRYPCEALLFDYRRRIEDVVSILDGREIARINASMAVIFHPIGRIDTSFWPLD